MKLKNERIDFYMRRLYVPEDAVYKGTRILEDGTDESLLLIHGMGGESDHVLEYYTLVIMGDDHQDDLVLSLSVPRESLVQVSDYRNDLESFKRDNSYSVRMAPSNNPENDAGDWIGFPSVAWGESPVIYDVESDGDSVVGEKYVYTDLSWEEVDMYPPYLNASGEWVFP